MNISEKISKIEYFKKLNLSDDLILDQLTKTVSRRYILSYISYLITKNTPFSLSIIDVDNFKNINDNYGHLVGDELLNNLTTIITNEIDDDTIVARYGGDEFLIVSTSGNDYDLRWRNLRKLFVAIRKPLNVCGNIFNVTCSCGQSTYPDDAETYNDLFLKADRTLYRAKNKGRNCFVIYDKVLHQNLKIGVEESLYNRMISINNIFTGKEDLYYEIYEALINVSNAIGIDGCALIENNNKQLVYNKNNPITLVKFNDEIMTDKDILLINERSKLDPNSKICYFMVDSNIKSCAIIKLVIEGKFLGYIIGYNNHVRIWQDEETALFTYFGMVVGNKIYYKDR